MTLGQLNNELTSLMKEFIQQRDHIDTGKMYKSVKFTSSMVSGDLKIKFTAPDYIKYLDNGEFIKDFFNLSSVNDIITTFVAEDLEDQLQNL